MPAVKRSTGRQRLSALASPAYRGRSTLRSTDPVFRTFVAFALLSLGLEVAALVTRANRDVQLALIGFASWTLTLALDSVRSR